MLEIEKKYRLTAEQRDHLSRRLQQIGATLHAEQFEENTLYRGASLEPGKRALRLRRVEGRALLTFKERLPSAAGIKYQHEEETEIGDPDVLHQILMRVGFVPVLIYEKRRTKWLVENVEVVLDELPFGLFMEIEGSEDEIERVERLLGAESLEVEHATYPTLTLQHGETREGIIEARFVKDSGQLL